MGPIPGLRHLMRFPSCLSVRESDVAQWQETQIMQFLVELSEVLSEAESIAQREQKQKQ